MAGAEMGWPSERRRMVVWEIEDGGRRHGNEYDMRGPLSVEYKVKSDLARLLELTAI